MNPIIDLIRIILALGLIVAVVLHAPMWVIVPLWLIVLAGLVWSFSPLRKRTE